MLEFIILVIFSVKVKDEHISSWKFWKKRRYVVGVLAFFGFFTSYILRVNLSVAIVAMTAKVRKIDDNGKEYFVSKVNYRFKYL